MNRDPDPDPAFQVNLDPIKGFDDQKFKKKVQLNFLYIFSSENAIYSFLGFLKDCYRIILHPSKENNQQSRYEIY
jgi:hypothetical protein